MKHHRRTLWRVVKPKHRGRRMTLTTLSGHQLNICQTSRDQVEHLSNRPLVSVTQVGNKAQLFVCGLEGLDIVYTRGL